MNTSNASISSRDRLVEYIRNCPEGVTSAVLAETVLKFKSPAPFIAHKMISGILENDRRLKLTDNNLWVPMAIHSVDDDVDLKDIAWAAVYVLSDETRKNGSVLFVSVWELTPEPHSVFSHWTADPSLLSHEDREVLMSPFDLKFSPENNIWQMISETLDSRTCVFLSRRHQGLLTRDLLNRGESFAEDTMTVSSLIKASGLETVRPLNLESVYRAVFSNSMISGSAFRQAQCFAECLAETIRRLVDLGITTRANLEQTVLKNTPAAVWPNLKYPKGGIESIPKVPGVYGFKNKDGTVIYVGKSKNLRRRLLSYFQAPEDCGTKLMSLREKSCDLIISECGSELESLILEYRLIKKYKPELNTQVSIDERKGTFLPTDDCIIMLPHAQHDKGMSVWIKKDKKILLRPFFLDFSESSAIIQEINAFFFSTVPLPSVSDFPEMEIVHRWIKRREDNLVIVPVHRLSTAEEVYDWMKNIQ